MDMSQLMQLYGMMSGGGAGAAAAAPGLAQAFAPDLSQSATQAFGAGAAPAMGSGVFGNSTVMPGIMQMMPKGGTMAAAAPVAQGTGPVLAQGFGMDDASLNKLAQTPIDPQGLLKLLEQTGQQPAPNVSAGMPSGGRGTGKMQEYKMGEPGTKRKNLFELFGGS